MKVSTLILTYNEEINLPSCLSALDWCDDIVVVDSGSVDNTVQIAENAGARVLVRKFDNFANQRNYGLEYGSLKNDWVLHLDADEILTDHFIEALRSLVPLSEIDAYNVPSKTMLFGKWLRYAGMWPTYQVRLGHRERLKFKQVGHGQREDLPPCKVSTFNEPYLHYSFSHGMKRWLEKHIQYAKDDAMLVLEVRGGQNEDTAGKSSVSSRRRAKNLAAHMPLWLRPMARFIYIYLIRQGFRDGSAGLAYAIMLSVYEGMITIFAYESLLSKMNGKG